jgi:ADP-ribosylglycohydrolase
MRQITDYTEQIYAGVLGKIIGVYLGRPVEGWPYDDIRTRFGEVAFYVNDQLGVPLVVADDDISGTFGFFRAVDDSSRGGDVSARDVGDAWLNYIIENKTILWWGGLGRSTEHTAYLRLKSGIPAPRSGSAELNGRTLSEQIGAQIFIDAFAMMHPGDPQRAADVVREAASVSHDGLALEAASFLGAMEAMAFDEPSMGALIERCRGVIASRFLHQVIDDVLEICGREHDWREVRGWLDERYGYDKFPGPCNIVTNHAMVLASLLLGGDSFHRSVTIAASAGWDTDCNAGNVGCLNGIRLGLDAITAEVDLRAPVADRLLVVTSDGGSCVSDAVQQTRHITSAAAQARGVRVPQRASRFAFEFPGSTQGFVPCPHLVPPIPNVTVRNDGGLVIECRAVGPGLPASVSTPVFLDPSESGANFSTLASPTLYPGQVVTATVRAGDVEALTVRLYILQPRPNGSVEACFSEPFEIKPGTSTLSWRVPDVGNAPVVRFGVRLESSRRFDGEVVVESVDWSGAPDGFAQTGLLMSSIWDTTPLPLSAWVSSAANFEADFRVTYAVSHPAGFGLVTIGTRDWDDYAVTSTLIFNLHRSAGLVVRAVGHRRYYAAVFSNGTHAALVKQHNGQRQVLATAPWSYDEDVPQETSLECIGPQLHLVVNGDTVLTAVDRSDPFLNGGAGFVVEEGTLLADGFHVRRPATSTTP